MSDNISRKEQTHEIDVATTRRQLTLTDLFRSPPTQRPLPEPVQRSTAMEVTEFPNTPFVQDNRTLETMDETEDQRATNDYLEISTLTGS